MRYRGRHVRSRRHHLVPMIAGGLMAGLAALAATAAPPSADPTLDPASQAGLPSAEIDESPRMASGAAVDPVNVVTGIDPTSTTVPRREFTLAFTGDVLIHTGVRNAAARHGEASGRAYDFRPMLAPIEPVVSGVDWAICHMEVNLSADGTRLATFPRFRAPGEIAADLADIGYDGCSTGSNHSVDHGFEGLAETISVLEEAKLRHSGTAAADPGDSWGDRFEIDGATVAHLSYTFSLNGLPVPAEAPWSVALIDEDRILADASKARSEGADLVVVSMHWGWEYRHDLSYQQAELGPALLASPDIDLVIGHHAHVVQPIERIGGKWIAYGLGNLLSNQTQLPRRDELMVIAHVQEASDGTFGVSSLSAVPLYLDPTTHTVYPSGPALRPSDVDATLASELDASWARVSEVLATSDADVLG